MKNKNKRGIEPVVATVGLVGISIALFVIVFIWSRSFVAEEITKFGNPVEEQCDSVSLDISATLSDNNINFILTNTGNINIYQIKVDYFYEGGSTSEFYTAADGLPRGNALETGKAASFSITPPISPTAIEKINVYPVLLGEGVKTKQTYTFVCEELKKEIIL